MSLGRSAIVGLEMKSSTPDDAIRAINDSLRIDRFAFGVLAIPVVAPFPYIIHAYRIVPMHWAFSERQGECGIDSLLEP